MLKLQIKLEKEMETHSSILAWRIPWTDAPGQLYSIESQRAVHNWVTNTIDEESAVVM